MIAKPTCALESLRSETSAVLLGRAAFGSLRSETAQQEKHFVKNKMPFPLVFRNPRLRRGFLVSTCAPCRISLSRRGRPMLCKCPGIGRSYCPPGSVNVPIHNSYMASQVPAFGRFADKFHHLWKRDYPGQKRSGPSIVGVPSLDYTHG